MKIHFCGAAETTTGSQHLLEVNGKRIGDLNIRSSYHVFISRFGFVHSSFPSTHKVAGRAVRRGFNRSISCQKIEEGTDIHFVGLILAITEI